MKMTLKINIKLIKLIDDVNRFNNYTYHHKEPNYNNTQLNNFSIKDQNPSNNEFYIYTDLI